MAENPTAQIARLEVLVERLLEELEEVRQEVRDGRAEVADMKKKITLGKGAIVGAAVVIGAFLLGVKEMFLRLTGI